VIKADLITYNTFIKGCTQLKLYDRIDYMFQHLINNKDVGITPNDVTFNSLIDAYVRQNNMNKVFKLLSTMQQYHIKPDNFTYTTIIKGLNKDSINNNIIFNNESYINKNKNKVELDIAFQLFEKF
jgi:pentatricopeptide repeat protein